MTLAEHNKARLAAYYAARETRIRAIADAATKLATNIRSEDANFELMQALRAEFGDGQGFEAACEDADGDVGFNRDAGEYQSKLDADAVFDRSRRVDLLSAWGR